MTGQMWAEMGRLYYFMLANWGWIEYEEPFNYMYKHV